MEDNNPPEQDDSHQDNIPLPEETNISSLRQYLRSTATTLKFIPNFGSYSYRRIELPFANEPADTSEKKAPGKEKHSDLSTFAYCADGMGTRILVGEMGGLPVVTSDDNPFPLVFGEITRDQVVLRFHPFFKIREHWAHINASDQLFASGERENLPPIEQRLEALESATLSFHLPTMDPAVLERKLDSLQEQGLIDPELKVGAVTGVMQALISRGESRDLNKVGQLALILQKYTSQMEGIAR